MITPEIQKKIDELRKNAGNSQFEETSKYFNTGLYYEGICSSESKQTLNEKNPEELKIIEEAEFKSADGEVLYYTSWHDLNKGEMPFEFSEGVRYRFQVKNLSGGWNDKVSKRQFKTSNVSQVQIIDSNSNSKAKPLESGKGKAA